jgi:hypothetical protein
MSGKCTECFEECDGRRCKKCNPLKSRLQRLPDKLKEEFASISKESRIAFFKEQHDKMGNDLKVAVTTVVDEEKTTTLQVSMQGTGELLDEVELDTKYNNNPKRLEAIKKFTRTVTDPTTKILLYEDMRYKTTFTDTETNTKSEKRTIEHDGKMKATKHAKTEKVTLEDKAKYITEEKPLTSAQKKKCEAAKEKLVKIRDNFATLTQKAIDEAFNDLIPNHILKKVNGTKIKADSLIGETDLLLVNDAGKFKEWKDDITTFKTESKQIEGRFENCVAEATLQHAEREAAKEAAKDAN